MKNLLYKELKLSINKFFFIIPFLTGALFLIPQWVFFLALMYFFFISVPNIYSAYNSQNDIGFSIMMPVKKRDIVKSKILSFITLELLHFIAGAIYAVINISVFKKDNFMMDLNLAFFGLAFIMYALFNLIFFPLYFRTAYNYGLPTIIASVVSLLFAFGIEMLVIFNRTAAGYLEGKSPEMRTFQLLLLITGIILFVVSNIVAYKISAKKFETIDL